MQLREFNAEIREGHVLLVDCLGVNNGQQHCCGKIRIPFDPPLTGFSPWSGGHAWKRTGGDTVDTITLEPSIDAGDCGHFLVRDGAAVRA